MRHSHSLTFQLTFNSSKNVQNTDAVLLFNSFQDISHKEIRVLAIVARWLSSFDVKKAKSASNTHYKFSVDNR